ncbi:MAG: transcription termination factor NusA [Candidatus Desulfovibrio faecigallinarum]|uniref:transcription termination factor NusA n=1 Tax=Desulfovibrio sp. An276 TaxID=1965618 RepID=UPI000B388A27|nr:transcription termination factor NusA [Desulfovibrio sp. An276]MBU3831672.1 transcription termination factor NusA [Candidatus Desulfovibrio faecigallinarum]OUO51189.1 transcription termination/antitermination protein NusA [Desulfovibrio sp. An276]
MNQELKKAIDQICKDKSIDADLLVETLEDAVRTSVQRRYAEDMSVEVSYNRETGDIEVYQFKIVVPDDELDNPDREIEFTEARKLDESVQIDDEMGFRIKIQDLGRIAAQSAKQVIIQRLRDAEQANIYNDYKERIGEIVTGSVQRREKSSFVINLDRTEAILPRDQQISKEHYRRGDNIQAIIIDVHREGRGPQVVLSRSHPDYITALFHREVPEVDEGIIQIMGVARDPGSRAKVAVYSREREVDAVGACVGVRGARIQNIVQELRGERIDIVIWNADIATYARNALAPALVSRIIVDEPQNQLEVIVPDDQLTNAIGRKGQNVKLAARLLGWKVDIFTESRYNEASAAGHSLEQVAGVAEIPVASLQEAGYTDLDKLRQASDEELVAALSLTESQLEHLRQALNFLNPGEDGGAKPDATADVSREEAHDEGQAE